MPRAKPAAAIRAQQDAASKAGGASSFSPTQVFPRFLSCCSQLCELPSLCMLLVPCSVFLQPTVVFLTCMHDVTCSLLLCIPAQVFANDKIQHNDRSVDYCRTMMAIVSGINSMQIYMFIMEQLLEAMMLTHQNKHSCMSILIDMSFCACHQGGADEYICLSRGFLC
jgi:hypothetical protein